ncbi:hypothetical protein RirG_197630 [Rhizophagus irregularis DAOM 197198w]|uniref:FAR1 domain-containing protein n=1 Tax=Rhizophagus irregularis (strain DAOM 197198w) TaxID=1432141 RepID=A0A015IMN7_RHIIW|nr:hypothetical protein RirG_197630 [Rhizophagus irregularis DAOM 197198w]
MELLHRHNILFVSEDISNTPILTDDDISNNPVITIGKDKDENINDKIPDNIQDQLDTDETRVKIASENISFNTTFLSWEEVEDFLKDYGQRNGFAITKYRIEKNRSTQLITKRTFVCEFSERATCITVSLFANQHNHELRPDAFEFNSKYREFTKEMIDKIEIMTRYGNLSITLQRNLLKARFPKMNCSDSDLSNAIQKFKSLDRSNMHNDASDLLINLVQKKQEDPLFVKFELDNDNQLTHLMPLSVFVGVDNNGRTRLLVQAVISDETFETYQWILQCVLQATEK